MYEWKECRDRAHDSLECGRDDCPFIAAGRLIGMDLRGPGYHWHVVSDGFLATPYHAGCKRLSVLAASPAGLSLYGHAAWSCPGSGGNGEPA
jgi:hypothetical protein